MRVNITPRAYSDLKNIGRYTQQYWGKKQRNIYLRALEKRFQWLAMNPSAGKHRSDIANGYYSFPEGEHVIFYLIGDNAISIIGIPHKHMDIDGYFLPEH